MKVKPKENKNDYLNRCIEKFLTEGKTYKEAVAISNANYDQQQKENTYTNLSRYIENK